MNIFVGGLPYEATEEGLRSLFEDYGQVDTATIIMNKHTGRSRGFGFVEMSEQSEAESAIAALNGKEWMGRTLKVDEARPKPESRDRF